MFDKYIKGGVLVTHSGKLYLLDYSYIDSAFSVDGNGWYRLCSPLSIIHRVISPRCTHIQKAACAKPLHYCNRCYIAYMDNQYAHKLRVPVDADTGRYFVTVVYAVVPMGKERSRVVVKLYTPEGVLLAEQASNICFDIPGTPDISAPAIHGLIEWYEKENDERQSL